MKTFTVKKLGLRCCAVVVRASAGGITVEVPIYEVAGGRNPHQDCKDVARELNNSFRNITDRVRRRMI